MLATIRSSTIVGVEPLDVDVEVDVSPGLPAFEIVGLPGVAVREARDRVRTALRNAGHAMPPGRVTVNLAPAHVPKSGTLFDLPIALGILIAAGLVRPPAFLDRLVVVGELSLDGALRPVRGALCVAAALRGSERVLVLPRANEGEVNAVPGVRILPVASLAEMVGRMPEGLSWRSTSGGAGAADEGAAGEAEWLEIRGQTAAKRALEVAAAGGHHLMFVGPPGAGKTALARALAAISPALTAEEAVEVSQIHSVAGLLSESRPTVTARPFRSPHHTVTPAGLLGGGSPPRPGEISLAHRGFLFLDEFPEFQVRALEGLRQPLEEGRVVVSRVGGAVHFPAAFTLIAAANPCPCGFLGDPRHACTCSEAARQRYARRMSGPLMDRIDLVVPVRRPDVGAVLGGGAREEGIAAVRERVRRARARQRRRYGPEPRTNGNLTGPGLARWVSLDERGRRLLLEAGKRWSLSPRALHRVMRVARTVADLAERDQVLAEDVAEALSYRFPVHETGV